MVSKSPDTLYDETTLLRCLSEALDKLQDEDDVGLDERIKDSINTVGQKVASNILSQSARTPEKGKKPVIKGEVDFFRVHDDNCTFFLKGESVQTSNLVHIADRGIPESKRVPRKPPNLGPGECLKVILLKKPREGSI